MRRFLVMSAVCCGCVFRLGAEPLVIPEEELAIFDEFLLGTVDLERVSFYEHGTYGDAPYFYWNNCVFLTMNPAIPYDDDPAAYRPVILHELTHAWQDQHGIGTFNGDDDYAFTLLPERHLFQYGIEEQAGIIAASYQLTYFTNFPTSCQDCRAIGRDRAVEILDRRRDELVDAL